MNWIVEVDTTSRVIKKREVTPEESRFGGRGLVAYLMNRDVPAYADPWGRHNRFIVAAGLLADTFVTTSGKFSIGGKSPLTGGIKESDVGGEAGKKLARLGIRSLVVHGIPPQPAGDVLVVSQEGIRLEAAPELAREPVSAVFSRLRQRYGAEAGFIAIGPAGEMKLAGSGVAVSGPGDVQVRYGARGGLGAVLGAKGIKAIVIDDTGARPAAPADEKLLREAGKTLVDLIMADPKTENRHLFGTPAVLMLCNELGILPTRNFSRGRFERAEDISGEKVRELILARGGEGRAGTPCVRGCVISCSNIFPDAAGKKIVASLQYENIALLGSNLGIGDIDAVAELNHLCNEVGVCAIETGGALGVAMEAGVIAFGDAKGAQDLVRQIGKGTYLGRILGSGAALAGKILGVRRVPAVKGQGMPAYDPRALKGNGVTYITSPMGADHTAGNALETARTIDPLGKEKQVETSRRLQLRAAILDTFGLCLFTRPAFVKDPDLFGRLLKGRYGWDMNYPEIQALGAEVLALERDFNRRAGVSEEFFDMPEFMREEPLPPHQATFDIPREELANIWEVKVPVNVF
jgi:aldehyde:ferredoxin oxidoreductase